MSKIVVSKSICLSVFFAIALFSVSSFAQANNKMIESVDVLGNRILTDEQILSHIKTQIFQFLDKNQLQKDLDTLMKLGRFDSEDTKVITEEGRYGGVSVIFQVRELPIIDGVSFEGSNGFSTEEIVATLVGQKLNVEIGDVYQPAKIKKVTSFLREFLAERGFLNAKVEVWQEEVSAFSLKINFRIIVQP